MRKKTEFLNRLFDLIKCRTEILQFLREEKLITDDAMQNILHTHASMHASLMVNLFDELLNSEALQLVDYTWNILPKELLMLTIVSKTSKKEFTYSL